ncbi:MAG: histidinol-phosphate transaminase [Tannerellaceae bacterium]|jgi:histidinol-phosphate aminotransferase|nr:histidinol-phosphate transaminase [Tannerellaceae bacterium]
MTTNYLNDWLRPNIRSLKPYSSARDEFHGEASVFLDANENPYNEPYNRYPDPMQRELKQQISYLKDLAPEYIFTGNGSDEAIDLVIRAFCEPATDNIVTITPSYGMYEVAAHINRVDCIKVPLTNDFKLDAGAVLDAVDNHTKVIYLCSPNNPTGNLLNRDEIYRILKYFKGPVVIDEAYIDFASSPSFTRGLVSFPNLIVLQTLSKAWGAAGIRLGMAFASPGIIAVLNKIKYPYNVSRLTQEYALEVLRQEERMKEQLIGILHERTRLETALQQLPFVRKVYPSDANFILVRVNDANATYNFLVEKKVIVRNRHTVALCEDCIRITVGTPEENRQLLKALNEMKP